jgi:mono/diheme cytochrome c family protein
MKNIFIPWNIKRAVSLFLFSVLLSGCDRNRKTTGWDYFPDMFYSTAYETFTKNPNFEDSVTMRVPPAGTVPRNFTPFNYTIDLESRIRAGIELTNPVPSTDEIQARGKDLYTTFCIGCHGIQGAGDGQLFTSGLYPLKPRTLTGTVADNLKDGEIFHTITLGLGSMGAHGSQIRPEDRWILVHYIRTLQEEARKNSDNISK